MQPLATIFGDQAEWAAVVGVHKGFAGKIVDFERLAASE
jgi:hypothetical protein